MEIEGLLAEHEAFKAKAKEFREKVKVLCQLESSLNVSDLHAQSIRDLVQTVQTRYNDFSARCDKYQNRLESALGKPEPEVFYYY